MSLSSTDGASTAPTVVVSGITRVGISGRLRRQARAMIPPAAIRAPIRSPVSPSAIRIASSSPAAVSSTARPRSAVRLSIVARIRA